MLWNDEPDHGSAEEWLSQAGNLPLISAQYRARVMEAALATQRQSLSLHHIQTVVTSVLAAGLLLCLPGYYQSLRPTTAKPTLPLMPTRLSITPSSATLSSDSYEWGLVESALAARDQSARRITGTL